MRGLDDNLKLAACVVIGGIAGYAFCEWFNSKGGKELVKRVSEPIETTAKSDAVPVEKPAEKDPIVANVKANPMEGGRADGESSALVRDGALDE